MRTDDKVGQPDLGHAATLRASRRVDSPDVPPPPNSALRWKQAAQAAVAVGFAALVSYVAWRRVGSQLSVTTDIVGSTIFANVDIYRQLNHFYILVLLFPALAVASYLVLVRWGPLATPVQGPWPPSLVAADTEPAAGGAALDLAALVGVLARVGLPALVIAVEVGIARSQQGKWLPLPRGAAAGVAFAAVVGAVAMALGRRRGRAREVWSAVNAVLAAAVVPMLLLVSASTAVTIDSSGRIVAYPWLPVWLAAVATAVVLGLVARALVRGGLGAAPRVERRVLVVVVVPMLLFLATAVFQGAQGIFNGFDDAQGMVGARLMFSHGLWPWRDVYLLHGFFADGLYGGVGMWAFGDTRWASNTGVSFLVGPATLLCLYAFIVYFARKNYALVAAGCLGLVLGLLGDFAATRFALMPLILVLFDRVLRRDSWGRCLAFMALVVLTSIVTPESTILVVGILATLVIADLVHRRRGSPLHVGLRRTLRCAVAGVGLTLAWVVFLLATGCFSGFVAYYQTTIAGHELWGAHPIQFPFTGDLDSSVELVLPIVLFLLTVAKVAWKLHRREPWRPADWVLVASATAVPLLYQVVLYRYDFGHVDIAFQAAIPLVLLWAAELVSLVDSLAARAGSWFRGALNDARAGLARSAPSASVAWPWMALTPAALLAVIAVLVWSPLPGTGVLAGIPSAFHPNVPVDAPSGLPLGYTVPDAVDVAQIEDLGAVIDRYAGPSAPVFEFVNDMGIPYFLLDRVPGARFYHVESAQTATAQQQEVDDLARSRPPLVIFNDHSFGIPSYDGIWSMERNYLVSQYVLDQYQPFADVQGQLVLMRNDLVSTAPPLPQLHQAAKTTGLYFWNLPGCNWGTIPDFLKQPQPAEISAGVPAVTQAVPVITSGWAFDGQAHQPPVAVVAVRDGVVIAQTSASIARPDVVANMHDPALANSGWRLNLPATTVRDVTFYALNADGTASALPQDARPDLPGTIRTVQGASYTVVNRLSSGHVDQPPATLMDLTVPGSAPLSTYRWLEFRSPSGFGSHILLTDLAVPEQDSSHNISFDTLPRVGNTVYLRVGSCIQWHGFETRTLKLQGAPADVSVRLLP